MTAPVPKLIYTDASRPRPSPTSSQLHTLLSFSFDQLSSKNTPLQLCFESLHFKFVACDHLTSCHFDGSLFLFLIHLATANFILSLVDLQVSQRQLLPPGLLNTPLLALSLLSTVNTTLSNHLVLIFSSFNPSCPHTLVASPTISHFPRHDVLLLRGPRPFSLQR